MHRRKLENINGELSLVSHETIYAYIYSDYGLRNKWYKCLRRTRLFRYPKFARKHKTMIPNRVPISERPKEINERKDYGHWEGDLMVFKHGVKTNLITLRERKSRYLIAIKNDNRKAIGTALAIVKQLKGIKDLVTSITFDNGVEFCSHEIVAKSLNAKTYFCEPYKSYQKGSIENANKVLRHYFPRDIEIGSIQQNKIEKIVTLINQRPMKCLGFKTPLEIFHNQIKLQKNGVE